MTFLLWNNIIGKLQFSYLIQVVIVIHFFLNLIQCGYLPDLNES